MRRFAFLVIISSIAVSCERTADTSQESKMSSSIEQSIIIDSIISLQSKLDSLSSLNLEKLKALRIKELRSIEYTHMHFTPVPDEFNWYRNHGARVETAVYDGPDSTSKQIDMIQAGTYLKIIGNRENRIQVLYRGTKMGYIDLGSIYEYRIMDYQRQLEFLAYTSKSEPYPEREISIEVRNRSDRKLLTTKRFPFGLHGWRVYRIMTTLKDVDLLFNLVYFRESCPGTEIQNFWAYRNTEFDLINSSMATGEGGEYSYESMYFPVKFNDGKVLHLLNGSLQQVINPVTGELNSLGVPDSLDLDPENTVISKWESLSSVLDEDHRPIESDSGNSILVSKYEGRRYFSWNGDSLKLEHEVVDSSRFYSTEMY